MFLYVQLNKELAAYSKGQLERVDDAKTAKKLIRMFDLPQETYQVCGGGPALPRQALWRGG